MENIKYKGTLVKAGRTFIVAELSSNHMQKFDIAVKLIRSAAKAGADAVKMQAYTPDTMTIDMGSRHFRLKQREWSKHTLYQLYGKAYAPWKWFKRLKETAEESGLVFFATAFDRTSVDFLEELEVPVHKISSFELNDLPLIEYIGRTGKPLILSTGMASAAEIKEAVKTAKDAGSGEIILLKCVSAYPAKPDSMHLRTIADMVKRFGCPAGLSDHTLGVGVSIAAVCSGASVIEKHFTLSRKLKSLDGFFSIEPEEFAELVKSVRVAESALGSVHYGLTDDDRKNHLFRRSLFAVKDIARGEAFTHDNVRSIRPGHGLPPKNLYRIIGKKAKKALRKGAPLTRDII